jgi:hypothetical protein
MESNPVISEKNILCTICKQSSGLLYQMVDIRLMGCGMTQI